MVIGGMKSSSRPVTSGVPQGVSTGSNPVQHFHKGSECTFNKFASDMKPRGVADIPGGCDTIQKDINRLEKLATRILMQCSKGKCKVLHLEGNNSKHPFMLGATQLVSSFAEMNPGVPVEPKLSPVLPRWYVVGVMVKPSR